MSKPGGMNKTFRDKIQYSQWKCNEKAGAKFLYIDRHAHWLQVQKRCCHMDACRKKDVK